MNMTKLDQFRNFIEKKSRNFLCKAIPFALCMGIFLGGCAGPNNISDVDSSITSSGSMDADSSHSSAFDDSQTTSTLTDLKPVILDYSELEAATVLEEPVLGAVTNNPHYVLSVPTQMTRIGDDYFIVDCYHNQVITSTDKNAPLTEWKVLTDQMIMGHTIASDGVVYLVDDTENHRVLIFEKIDGNFYLTQTFDNVGNRPHYVEYVEEYGMFYVLSSMTGEMYRFVREEGSSKVYLADVLSLPDYNGIYMRSFTIDGDYLYLTPCDGTILKTLKSNLEIVDTYIVPSELAGLIQVTPIQDYFYITVSTNDLGDASYASIVRTKDLASLASGEYEVLYDTFDSVGTPYYISSFDGHYYLTHHCYISTYGVWEFDVVENELMDVKVLLP